jgi:hypothetical protein
MIAIRRLCDDRRDVITLRRALIETRNVAPTDQIDKLLSQLGACDYVCNLVNDYVAHTANPFRRPNHAGWNLQVGQMTEGQKAICEVAIILDRDPLGRKSNVRIIPVPQFDIMREFRPWVPDSKIETLREFWRAHNDAVNAWIPKSPL